MKKMLKKELVTNGALSGRLPDFVHKLISVITGEIPEHLKVSIALSELITFTSHLRKHIQIHDGTLVPCNAITFSLAKSGVSKDSSMNMVRKVFKDALEVLNDMRKELAKQQAMQEAEEMGEEPSVWLKYYKKPKELYAGLGTVEGLVAHFKAIEDLPLGAGFIQSSEIGSDLLSNPNLVDIIKIIAIGYDLGKIPSKILKAQENQTDSIECLPVNALFFGSQDAILYDQSVKNKFKLVFSTQLARRSIFSFTNEKPQPLRFKTVDELYVYREKERELAMENVAELKQLFEDIVHSTNQEPLLLSIEAQRMFDVYKEYNNIISEEISLQYPISRLSRKHKQWLALKLSGNIAILHGHDRVELTDYVQAIDIVEYFNQDLIEFEKELIKEPYELFVDFCKHAIDGNKLSISLHTLKKMGYISGMNKLKELVQLANSYDKEGIYSECDDGVCYEKLVKAETVEVSAKEVTGTKEERATKVADGYDVIEATFDELADMLRYDYAYSNFKFKNGKRCKDCIVGGTKWIVLDVDDSNITDEEAHLLLEDLNHHIARTSNSENPYKFRVLIELDSIVDIDDIKWKKFMLAVQDELGIKIDILPKSQIYYSYEGREVLSTLDGEPLRVKHLLEKVEQEVKTKKAPTKNEIKKMLDNKFDTFKYAFEAKGGEGSRSLIRAAYHAKDLGMSEEQIIDLMREINDYWVYPMDEDRLEVTILSQIRRWF